MSQQGPCEMCGSSAEWNTVPPNWPLRRTCPRCGVFELDELPLPRQRLSPDEKARFSGCVREQNAVGVVPRINREILRRVTNMRVPGLRERADHVLSVIARDHWKPDAWFVPETLKHNPELLGVSYSADQDELFLLFKILEEQGFLRWGQGAMAELTVKGLLAAEALGASKSSAAQGFVAMWFDPSLQDAWISGFDPGIRSAGFLPFRIDNKDYIGGISDEIMAEIRRSRFVVADYTGHRGGVYFEAGFALGLGLKVIPSCREDEISELHFDIKHLNTLVWNTPADLADKLEKRIRAVIGAGPNATDP